MNRSDYMAYKQQHPKKPVIGWQVKIRSQVYYEHKDIQLCWFYIRTHQLNTVPTPKYS